MKVPIPNLHALRGSRVLNSKTRLLMRRRMLMTKKNQEQRLISIVKKVIR